MIKGIHVVILAFLLVVINSAQSLTSYSFRYYRPGNTGIMGDYSDALWVDHDNNPYIGGYFPLFEEGGFSKYLQEENRWINYSTVDYPEIGNYITGDSRINEIIEDEQGVLWMAHWRGIIRFDPLTPESIHRYDDGNSAYPGGRAVDIDIAPDGTVWAAVLNVSGGLGGVTMYNPSANVWKVWMHGVTLNNWPGNSGSCDQLDIQVIGDGVYKVWIHSNDTGRIIVYDSSTEMFTQLLYSGLAGEIRELAGKKSVDAQNNLWAVRVPPDGSTNFVLDYISPEGTWTSPAQVTNSPTAFTAFGDKNALLVNQGNNVYHFNGTSWVSYGVWASGNYTADVNVSQSGDIWVCGSSGAAKYSAATQNWQRYRISNTGQIDYFVHDLSIDSSGNIWMSGNASPGVGGFQKFDGERWIPFNNYHYGFGYDFDFASDNVDEIAFRTSNGNIVFNPTFDGIHEWNGTEYISLEGNLVSRGFVEDSEARLWSIGEYFSLRYFDGTQWISVGINGWGANIDSDISRTGTVWASTSYEIKRTDGIYSFTRNVTDFPELDPQSDNFTEVVTDAGGKVWAGSNQGLFLVDPHDGTYQFYSPANSEIPGNNITPLAKTPDGKLWFSNFDSENTVYGLCWFDGNQFGILPVENGGLPHAQIYDLEVKLFPDKYELWMSCLSKGIAVLTVEYDEVPVELIDFNVSVRNAKPYLEWSTATETNNKGFYIERKTESTPFERIMFIPGHGTTTESNNYQWQDNYFDAGKAFYRLAQTDYNGATTFSKEVEINLRPDNFSLGQNYPNPFNPSTKIKFALPVESKVTVTLYTMLGQKVKEIVSAQYNVGLHEVNFNGSELSSGMYIYTITAQGTDGSNFVNTKKMMLMK